jgi:hypothetical protein
MNNNRIVLALVLTALVGCSNPPEITLAAEGFTEADLAICKKGDCPTITADFIFVTQPETIGDKINPVIREFVARSFMNAGDETAATTQTPLQAAEAFAKRYQRDKEEFPEMTGSYEAVVTVRDSYLSQVLLSVEMKQYTYTGGAHGYGSTEFANFNPETGNTLSVIDLFFDLDEFKSLAEQHFREKYAISKEASINATGFWFENERFHLPNSIGFSDKGAILHYNPYDIASYAEGAIEFTIPWEEVAPLLAEEITPNF